MLKSIWEKIRVTKVTAAVWTALTLCLVSVILALTGNHVEFSRNMAVLVVGEAKLPPEELKTDYAPEEFALVMPSSAPEPIFELEGEKVLKELTVVHPAGTDMTTYDSQHSLIGASDPAEPLLLNGEEVERTKNGYFSLSLALEIGENIFTLEHKEKTQSYIIRRSNDIIQAVYPSREQTVSGGAEAVFTAIAKAGAEISMTLDGRSIPLLPELPSADEGYIRYEGTLILPAAQESERSLGEPKFTALFEEKSESKKGGVITLAAKETVAGSGRLLAEVVTYQAETLDEKIDDYSRAVNTYLPAGTVDYCSDNEKIYFGSSSTRYRLLDYGKRVYVSTDQKGDNIRLYKGSLPESNSVSVASENMEGRHTSIAFNVEWKAPFACSLSPQRYEGADGPGRPNYNVDSLSAEYFDIRFYYASAGTGVIKLEGDPVFSRAIWTSEGGDAVLRLYLKKTGAFYGYSAEYDENDRLVFSFLHPAKPEVSDNKYGFTLNGISVVLDPGHGGPDPGAVGSNPKFPESALNLSLASRVRRELEAIGAHVVMTRTENESDLRLDERVRITKRVKPNLFVSIHRNASVSVSSSGYENYYYLPYSQPAAKAMFGAVSPGFTEKRGSYYGPYYVTRLSDCPAILTENGYLSNAAEFQRLLEDGQDDKLAEAVTAGIVNFFAAQS
ncbi:MAG TPA: hypothetical protein DEQ02_02960 [Ruminococcaceae bacterium]|nr:hypothetical protein [Oscillospiraceae bacterium]